MIIMVSMLSFWRNAQLTAPCPEKTSKAKMS